MAPRRTKRARGIYEDAFGLSVIYQGTKPDGTRGPLEHRFPLGTSIERLTKWRANQIEQEQVRAPKASRHGLARDVVRYLKPLKGLPCYKSEKSHLKAWLHALGPTTRRAVKADRCETIIADWRQAGYSARTIRHRVRVLRAVYRKLDGARTPTPLDDLRVPKKPKPRPVSVADSTIEAVALELRKHEIAGTLRDAKTRARYLLRMTHSQRPIEFQRAQPEDIDLLRRLWFVRGAKGGYNTVVPLNEEQVAAWQLCIDANAWGVYDSRSFAKTLRRAGWPKGIRPYNLRHSTGFALDARDVDLGDIQGLMGHTSPETTRAFYVPGLIKRLAAATAKLEGRFSPAGFLPRASLPRTKARQAKAGQLRRKNRSA